MKNDLTGKTFGYLTALKIVPNYAQEHNLKDNHHFWECECVCGEHCVVSSSRLTTGEKTSCGCKNPSIHDYTGQQIGRLFVIGQNREYTKQFQKQHPKNRHIFWDCRCTCGNICIRSSQTLKGDGNHGCDKCSWVKDITGTRNGKLVAQYFIKTDEKHNAIWHFKCDCGREVDMTTTLFRLVYSCGCLKISIGEYNIQQILNNNNIKYIFNKPYFKDLVTVKGNLARYDFILFNEQDEVYRIIEFDGIQHTDLTTNYSSPEIMINDKIKNEYAKKHNYPLVRIPYYERDNITLEMLMSDKYLVNFDNNEEEIEQSQWRE